MHTGLNSIDDTGLIIILPGVFLFLKLHFFIGAELSSALICVPTLKAAVSMKTHPLLAQCYSLEVEDCSIIVNGERGGYDGGHRRVPLKIILEIQTRHLTWK